MHNLLYDPLISIRTVEGKTEKVTLPQVFESLMTDSVLAFTNLRSHQRHAWHAFLVQLATIALRKTDTKEIPEEKSAWLEIIRHLTQGFPNDEPWELIVSKLSKPAFMQTPVVGDFKRYKNIVETPDSFDVLVTAKNHDLKQDTATRYELEDWLFTLVNLQTMAGVLGAGNYGIARMNGGFSTRPCLGLAPADGNIGNHIRCDITRLCKSLNTLLGKYTLYYDPNAEAKLSLLWLNAWDGNTQLDLHVLDPHFVEICRLVRLTAVNGRIVARKAGTKKTRVHAKSANGDIGDFWTPVDTSDGKALSISVNGFPYWKIAELLTATDVWQLPPAMAIPESTTGNWRVVARGVAGGQGKTHGYHERSDIILSPTTAQALLRPNTRKTLADLCKDQLVETQEVGNALRFGIAIAASGGKRTAKIKPTDYAPASLYTKFFDEYVDSLFFISLDRRFQAKDEENKRKLRAEFSKDLIEVAKRLLVQAIRGVPSSAASRYRARVQSMGAFWGKLRGSRSIFVDQPEIFVGND